MGEEALVSEARSHPERGGVYAAGMDGKSRVLPWEICLCLVLEQPRGWSMGGQKSADGIVGECQAKLVRHSETERWSKPIGRAVTTLTEGLNK